MCSNIEVSMQLHYVGPRYMNESMHAQEYRCYPIVMCKQYAGADYLPALTVVPSQ